MLLWLSVKYNVYALWLSSGINRTCGLALWLK